MAHFVVAARKDYADIEATMYLRVEANLKPFNFAFTPFANEASMYGDLDIANQWAEKINGIYNVDIFWVTQVG